MNLIIRQENKFTGDGLWKKSIDIIKKKQKNISFSVIWNFFDFKFYIHKINKNKNTHHKFTHFLIKIKILRESKLNDKDDKYCIIYDNVSTYKTKIIKKIAEKNKIKIMTIPPYWPVLKTTENVF